MNVFRMRNIKEFLILKMIKIHIACAVITIRDSLKYLHLVEKYNRNRNVRAVSQICEIGLCLHGVLWKLAPFSTSIRDLNPYQEFKMRIYKAPTLSSVYGNCIKGI